MSSAVKRKGCHGSVGASLSPQLVDFEWAVIYSLPSAVALPPRIVRRWWWDNKEHTVSWAVTARVRKFHVTIISRNIVSCDAKYNFLFENTPVGLKMRRGREKRPVRADIFQRMLSTCTGLKRAPLKGIRENTALKRLLTPNINYIHWIHAKGIEMHLSMMLSMYVRTMQSLKSTGPH